MHQCWALKSEQRPPFLAIFDCLVSRYFNPVATFLDGIWSPSQVKCDWLTNVLPTTVHLRTCEPRQTDSMNESLNALRVDLVFLAHKLGVGNDNHPVEFSTNVPSGQSIILALKMKGVSGIPNHDQGYNSWKVPLRMLIFSRFLWERGPNRGEVVTEILFRCKHFSPASVFIAWQSQSNNENTSMIHWANREANSIGVNSLCSSRHTVDLQKQGSRRRKTLRSLQSYCARMIIQPC